MNENNSSALHFANQVSNTHEPHEHLRNFFGHEWLCALPVREGPRHPLEHLFASMMEKKGVGSSLAVTVPQGNLFPAWRTH